jgi:adenosylcobinamide-GDP ribazoletransferase
MSARFSDDLAACLRFYSRLPVRAGADGGAMPDFRRAARALPVAGAIIGACGGAALLVARLVGVPALPASVLAIAALVAVTGALHEDGLADVADGFGGGATREAKLEIMRDSRLGSYGAAALVLVLLLRVSALAAIAAQGDWRAVLALIAAGAASRTAGLLPMMILAPARADGAGAAATKPDGDAPRMALMLAAVISLLPLTAGASLGSVVVADLGVLLAAYAVARLAQRQIGGLTGDVLGAAQQAAEIAVLLALSASA